MESLREVPHVAEKIAKVVIHNDRAGLPRASVIIVAYNSEKKVLGLCLDSLKEQTCKDFEILIMDNSDKHDVCHVVANYPVQYIKLKKNYGLSLARNIGMHCARGDIVVFLDDDAVPAPNFIESHVSAYKEYPAFGLRGKSLPRTRGSYNYLAWHYDLGDEIIPCYVNLEGNSSFKRSILMEMGGFNPDIQASGGHEGLELTYRIVSKYNDKSKVIYYPRALIYHNYPLTGIKFFKKIFRQMYYRKEIQHRFPDILDFAESYHLHTYKRVHDAPTVIMRMKVFVIKTLASFIANACQRVNPH